MSSNVGIIDTGTTLVMLSEYAFREYKKMTGATLDHTTGMLMITPQQYANLQDLTFNIGGEQFTLIPDAQIWPPSQNNLLPVPGRSDKIYLSVHELTEAAAQRVGYHFILGYTFIEHFYTVFDIMNRKVGFAKTRFTHANINY
ncbi:Aspartic peptidase domain containing protein [Tylopilus felleus]